MHQVKKAGQPAAQYLLSLPRPPGIFCIPFDRDQSRKNPPKKKRSKATPPTGRYAFGSMVYD